MLWQLDDWVLCRIYNKKGVIEKFNSHDQKQNKFVSSDVDEHETKPNISMVGDDQLYMDTSESVHRLHTDSSESEHVTSPDVTGVSTSPARGWCTSTVWICVSSTLSGSATRSG